MLLCSKMRTFSSQCTTKGEFKALGKRTGEVRWARDVLSEIGVLQKQPTMIHQDNVGSISWTEAVEGPRRVKHVGIKYFFVRESGRDLSVAVGYKPSSEILADLFTKALVGQAFENPRADISVIS